MMVLSVELKVNGQVAHAGEGEVCRVREGSCLSVCRFCQRHMHTCMLKMCTLFCLVQVKKRSYLNFSCFELRVRWWALCSCCLCSWNHTHLLLWVWQDCMCYRFQSPHHVGSRTPSSEEFISGEWGFLCQEFTTAEDNPHTTRHYNFLFSLSVLAGVSRW